MTLQFEITKDLHNLTIGIGYSFDSKQFAIGLIFFSIVVTKLKDVKSIKVNEAKYL